MSSLVIESPPAGLAVSLDLAKRHLRITSSAEDDLVTLYLNAATENFEDATGRSFIAKGYRQGFDGFPARSLEYVAPTSGDYGPIRYWNRLPNLSQMMKLFRSPLRHISRISYLALADRAWHDLLPVPLPWAASTEYALDDQVVDSNGNLQEVSAVDEEPAADDEDQATSSDATEPTWGADLNDETEDGDLTWKNLGPAPAGDFIYDRDAEPPRVFPLAGQLWPDVLIVPNCVVVHFESGYGDDFESVPARARVGILQLAGNYYQNRESVTADDLKTIPTQFDSLVWSLKVPDYSPTPG